MGLQAEILSIGNFNADLVKYYEFEEHYYYGLADNVKIMTYCLYMPGRSIAEHYAPFFGITDIYDIQQHAIINTKINFKALRSVSSKVDDFDHCVSALYEFVVNGYSLLWVHS